MFSRIEVYIISKEGGALLHKYNLLDFGESDKDQLVGGFLSALNSFAKEIGFPKGVGLIRSGNIEARYSPGDFVFSVLIIDYNRPLGPSTEKILSGIADEITQKFERRYHDLLVKGQESHLYRSSDYAPFRDEISFILDIFGQETVELYHKLILVESLYAKVPQKWILPIMEKLSDLPDISAELGNIPTQYHDQILSAIEKVHYGNKPVWDLFAVPEIRLD